MCLKTLTTAKSRSQEGKRSQHFMLLLDGTACKTSGQVIKRTCTGRVALQSQNQAKLQREV